MAKFQKVIEQEKEEKFFDLCEHGSAQEVFDAIKEGVNLDARDEGGFTYLVNAARKNTPDVLKVLIDAGIDINAKGYDGGTALMFAFWGNKPENVRFLLKAGADVTPIRYDGITTLMLAAKKETPEIVKFILDAGAITEINAEDTNGMTALLNAAMNNPNPEIVNILIEAGADDIKNINGRTALILAAAWNVPEVVDALIEAGSDVKVKDKDGKTALDYARENEKLKNTATFKKLEKLSA